MLAVSMALFFILADISLKSYLYNVKRRSVIFRLLYFEKTHYDAKINAC